jgi:hypothetical protein
MTRGTFFFKRAGIIGFVATGALLVKGVGSLGDFCIAFIRRMTFTARLGLIVFIFSQSVVAVTTRQPVTGDRVMLFVFEYDVARRDIKL